jgi:hypothetical protein
LHGVENAGKTGNSVVELNYHLGDSRGFHVDEVKALNMLESWPQKRVAIAKLRAVEKQIVDSWVLQAGGREWVSRRKKKEKNKSASS